MSVQSTGKAKQRDHWVLHWREIRVMETEQNAGLGLGLGALRVWITMSVLIFQPNHYDQYTRIFIKMLH
jgi:hypothetical protein